MLEIFPQESLVYILPVLIFLSRIFDVSLGTLRIVFVNKGMRYLAPVIGFFEVLIWLIVISQIMKDINSPINYIAYAAGFAAGNYVGILIEQKLAMGISLVRIITSKKATELLGELKSRHYSVTVIPAKTNGVDVAILFLPALRKDIEKIIETVTLYNPHALYTIEDVRQTSNGAMPIYTYDPLLWNKSVNKLFRYMRKSK
ncbi:MAG: DUF2179 domain-containing protein [Candidatus Cloacimonetes bacterium]|nr:DUF2179 domain-containing protein [Candidatus Cloacimonadota bacterium]